MKIFRSAVVFALFAGLSAMPALAKGGSRPGSHSVRGYVKKNGTYVAPHRQTNPNRTQRDNWSTKGNVNPYTGKPGTKTPTR